MVHPVFTYREMMQLVLKYTQRRRPIISLPFSVGMLQGLVLEQLPTNIFTITRAQVSLTLSQIHIVKLPC